MSAGTAGLSAPSSQDDPERPPERTPPGSAPEPPRRLSPRLLVAISLALGLALGFAAHGALDFFARAEPGGAAPTEARVEVEHLDARDVGLHWGWLVFGFGAQALFTARMLTQWLASEKARSSVVPTVFWWLSLAGGLMLLTYFLRRGDPVGTVGQLFGVAIYGRNLYFIYRRRPAVGE